MVGWGKFILFLSKNLLTFKVTVSECWSVAVLCLWFGRRLCLCVVVGVSVVVGDCVCDAVGGSLFVTVSTSR